MTPPPVSPSPADTRRLAALRAGTILVLLLGSALLAIWLWSRFCRFPTQGWNDMRLAPTIALAQGWPVYPTANDGTITTWMYGPLPLLVMWPATWAKSAAEALLIAAGLNQALTLVPLALACCLWPAPAGGGPPGIARFVAFVACLVVWPELHYSVIFSDNLAIACGLIGGLVLVRARGPSGYWLAAVLAAAAVGCKQIAVGIPLAQVIWCGLTGGWSRALRHAGRCAVAGAILAAGAIGIFGGRGLWFTLVGVPGGLSWAPNLGVRLWTVAPVLVLMAVVPAVAMLCFRSFFRDPARLLPALTWACTLPLGVAGLLKVGGWTNSIHSFVLWLPPVLTCALVSLRAGQRCWLTLLGVALLSMAGVTARLVREPELHLAPQLAVYHEAAKLAARYPRGIWFPTHPLVTLFSDRRYYHDEDGMYARLMSRKPISPEHLASQLPSELRIIALCNTWSTWGIARRMTPEPSREEVTEQWTLRSSLAAAPP